MASVVFIIRIPYEEEDPESSKTDEHGQPKSSDRNKEKGISRQTKNNDHHRSNGTKEINDNDNEPFDQNEAEIIDNSNRTNRSADDLEILTGPLNLAEVLQHELISLNVQGDSWTVTNDKEFHQVLFLEKTGERVENILARLTLVGIGKRQKSSVSIIPTSVHIQPQEYVARGVISQCESIPTSEIETQPLLVDEESTKDQFKRSIKSRLTVEQVVEGIRMQALLTFDFVMFTVLASLIAAVGLVEDNAVVLVASFLVSPLMGPILGGTFGMMIKNKSLRNTGLKTELYGLILSVVVGFLFGFICGPFGVNGASWDSAKGIWPTPEMTSRGMTRGLWVGVLIALPSGAAVALSVLGGNTCPLVGVAISASLLTPAVNFGMLWAYSIITAIKPPEIMENTSMSKCPPFKDNSYMPTYSCDMGTEAAIMAIISLVLTVVNIICIFITATIVLKIKKVAPKASSSNATQTFWTKDIKVAREAYETLKGNQASNLLKEWKKVQDRTKEGYRYPLQEIEELLDIVKEVEEEEDFQSVVRRAPRGAQNIHQFSRLLWKLVSKDDVDENITDKEAMNLQNQLRNLQTYYTLQPKEKSHQPHVGTIFSEPESSPKSRPKLKPKAKKGVREFHVVETENPHRTSVVRVHPPNEESNTYSVTTESGV